MKSFDGTPPADFPHQVIIMDREIALRHPEKGFCVRVASASSRDVTLIDLDGAISPVHARRLAIEKGYNPTHWIDAAANSLIRF
jgi:hypothetical protein